MFVFGVDVPLVELILAFTVIIVLVLIELIALMVLQLFQIKENKKILKANQEIGKLLLEIKDREVKLYGLKKQ